MTQLNLIQCDCCGAEEDAATAVETYRNFQWSLDLMNLRTANIKDLFQQLGGAIVDGEPAMKRKVPELCPTCQRKIEAAISSVMNPPAATVTIKDSPVLESIEKIEQRHIIAVLNYVSWNKSQAATILGIERSTLDRKLRRYNVTRPSTLPLSDRARRCPIHFAPENATVPTSNIFCTCNAASAPSSVEVAS